MLRSILLILALALPASAQVTNEWTIYHDRNHTVDLNETAAGTMFCSYMIRSTNESNYMMSIHQDGRLSISFALNNIRWGGSGNDPFSFFVDNSHWTLRPTFHDTDFGFIAHQTHIREDDFIGVSLDLRRSVWLTVPFDNGQTIAFSLIGASGALDAFYDCSEKIGQANA